MAAVLGMPGCTANCASETPGPGDQFIFKGGDTWNTSGSGQSVIGTPWVADYSGRTTGRIYFGVDPSWYDGSSFTRPALNMDNPTSTSPVANCANSNTALAYGSDETFDDFELYGFCDSLGYPTGTNMGMISPNGTGYVGDKFLNFYIHGWTWTNAVNTCCSSPNWGGAETLAAFIGSTQSGDRDNGNEYAYNVIDGSDSAPGGLSAFSSDSCWDINHNYVSNVANIVCGDTHIIADNVVQQVNENAGNSHGNTWEDVTSATQTDELFYNNVIRNIGNVSGIGVNLWPFPTNAGYFFNNVMYTVNQPGNYINVGENGQGNNISFFNDTWQCDPTNTCGGYIYRYGPATSVANDFVISGDPLYNDTPGSTATDLEEGAAAATSQGYTATNQYAPTSPTDPTVATGTNETGECSTLALPDLCRATTLAVGETTNHTIAAPERYPEPRPTTGPWDIGAYQYR